MADVFKTISTYLWKYRTISGQFYSYTERISAPCLVFCHQFAGSHGDLQLGRLMMRIYTMFPWSILNWMIRSIICQPAVSVLQYTMEELLQLCFKRFESTPDLHFYTDIFKPRRKYIHRGSRRNYKFDDSNSIRPSGHPPCV